VAAHRVLLALHSPLLAGLLGEAGEGAGLSLPLPLSALRGLVTLRRGKPVGEEVRQAAVWLGVSAGVEGVNNFDPKMEADSEDEDEDLKEAEAAGEEAKPKIKQANNQPKKELRGESGSDETSEDEDPGMFVVDYSDYEDKFSPFEKKKKAKNGFPSATKTLSEKRKSGWVPPSEKKRREKNEFPCDQCDNRCNTQYLLEKHRSVKHKMPIICHLCSQTLLLTEYKEHMYKNHHAYKCEICGVTKSTSTKMQFHIESAHKESTPCPHCGVQYSTKIALNHHIDRIHSEREEEQCTKCDYKSRMPAEMKRHVMSWHTEAAAVQQTCEYCGELFKRLDLHIKRTGCAGSKEAFKKEKVPCPRCAKTFANSMIMRRHIKRVHEGVKGKDCPQCSYSTYSSYNLKLHMSKTHFGQDMVKRQCPHCDKETTNLSYHIKLFHGEKDRCSPEIPFTEVLELP
jgi:hypothetical protein